MSDKPNPAEPVAVARNAEHVPSVEGQLSAIGSAAAPFVFFDGIAGGNTYNSVVAITLNAVRFMTIDGKPVSDQVIVAHLRTNIVGAQVLHKALSDLLLAALPQAGGTQ